MSLIDGSPIWFELATPEPAAAATFYRDVIGWTTAASPVAEHGGYVIAAAPDGDRIAGIMAPPPGAPTGWSLFVLAHDLAATLQRVDALGGRTVFGPIGVPQVGRLAIVHDPQGVALSLLQPDGEHPDRPFRQEAAARGHGVWIELATPDPDGAVAFYGALFGWTGDGAMAMGEMGDYAFLAAGSARLGAVMSSRLTGAPARWNMYFLVADIDAALAAATAARGRIIQGPDQIPGGDYSANILDPAGHQIGLVGPRGVSAA